MIITDYDVWGDDSGHFTVRKATKPIVYDSDSPYPYTRHLMRVESQTRKQAMQIFRAARKNGEA
ncbi:hypothetical protein M1V18_004379 [Salmonella enterica]|nr:hypothetical protein [Salmonella enterica]